LSGGRHSGFGQLETATYASARLWAGGNICFVEEPQIGLEVNLALKSSPTIPKQSSDLVLPVKQQHSAVAHTADRRL